MPILLDGVALQNASAPVLFQECRFPIMDLRRYQQPDEVVANMPTFIGEWANGTIAPAIASQLLNTDTVVNAADACRFPVVEVLWTSCAWIAPNQKLLGLETEQINWAQLIDQYCTVANIADPDRIGQIFNRDGTLVTGNPYTLNIVRTAMNTMLETMGLTFTQAAMVGDYANVNQFDGLYNQIDFGWENSDDECADELNHGNVIDWAELTDSATATASPDATVGEDKTVNLWGTVFAVPEGWNLADFLAFFMDGAGANYGRGKPINWEMHVPNGWRMAVLKALSCIQLCNLTSYPVTDALIARYERLVSGKIAELFGYGKTFPIFETAYLAPNSLRFGPRDLDGLPTYGMVFKNIVNLLRSLDPLGQALYGSGSGRPPTGGKEPLLATTRSQIINRFEANTIHWDFQKITAICVRAAMMLKAGVLATDRHLWLEIKNVGTTTFRLPAVGDWTINDVVVTGHEPPAPTLSAPADASSATDTTPTYDWADVTGAIDYRIQISTTAADPLTGEFDPDDIVRDAVVAVSTYTPTALALDQYFWHVNARTLDGTSNWSVERDHTITA